MSEQLVSFTFEENTNELMRIEADGRFFVRGVEVESTEEIRDTLASFARLCLLEGEKVRQRAARAEEALNELECGWWAVGTVPEMMESVRKIARAALV